MTYRLKKELRPKLKKPLGRLYEDGEESVKEVLDEKGSSKLATVGDVTTHNLLKQDVNPDLAIVDGRVMRKEASEDIKKTIGSWEHSVIAVENPAGHITSELIDAVKEGLDSDSPTLISVDGEEDLAVLPVALYAPEGYIVLYGQPKEGLVSVRVDSDCKNKVKSFMNLMEEI